MTARVQPLAKTPQSAHADLACEGINKMMMKNKPFALVVCGLLLLIGIGLALLPSKLRPVKGQPTAADDALHLLGVVHDFSSSHPDFNVTNPTSMGHFVGNVSSTLASGRVPEYTGNGKAVTVQWKDKNTNPIMPYGARELGLAGGHFDVDVYDRVTTSQKYHKHKFDDFYDTNFVDIANDPVLLFRRIIPYTSTTNLRMVFLNPGKGGLGKYEFQAGGALMSGKIADDFTATFNPQQLTRLKFTFFSLADMRGTKPGTSHADSANRDGAFAVRLYDASTNVLKYELAMYHHIDNSTGVPAEIPPPPLTKDSCGNLNRDTLGTFGSPGRGAVTDAGSFGGWFADRLGVNLSTRYMITLNKNAQGDYEYNNPQFYPIDGMLMGNEGRPHNTSFTYAISSTFIYHKCAGQFFEFQGSDDAWVFINGSLVIDLGGVNTPSRQYVALDRLGLADGQPFTLDFFYASRRVSGSSLFHMRTNLSLESPQAPPVITGSYD